MDITARLNELDELIREAKAMPLSSSVLVNRDDVLDLLAAMQEALPDEIKQARWIVRDREELLAKARAEGEQLIAAAHEDQLKMARKEAVVARATEEAERIVSEADDQARAMRQDAEGYVDGKLAQFETAMRRILEESQAAGRALSKTLDQVELGREKLRTPGTAAEQEFGSGPPIDLRDADDEGRHTTPLYDEEQP